MNDSIKKQLELVKEMATSKGYTFNIIERDTSQEEGLGSHYVDYANNEIEITLPLDHEEKDAILLHELFHAELFLTGFPKILMSPVIQYDEIDLDLFQHIENLSQHVLLYPKMNELNVMHDKENTKFLKNYLTNLLPDNRISFVMNAFILTESFYRNPVEFLNYESDIRKTHPNSDKLYRRLKRVFATIKSPLTARQALIRIFDIIEEALASCNYKYDFKEKCILKSVLLENQQQLFVSELFQLVKRPKLTHIYLQEKRTGYYVKELSSTVDFQKEKEFIKQVRCDKYLGLN